MIRHKILFVDLLVLTFLISDLAYAQRATLSGRVTDQTGAVIPGVNVTAFNVDTGIKATTFTNEEGYYVIPYLQPGNYRISVEMSGFKPIVRSGVKLDVQQVARIDFVLEVGELTQEINVVAGAPLLETENATVGTVVDNPKVVNLPLNGRDFTQLILLVSGASDRDKGQAPGDVGGRGTLVLSVNGQRTRENNYTLDGVENNTLNRQVMALSPSIDAIQEFKIQTNITSAEYGRSPGANINMAIKSGTNEFRGTFWEFIRNDNLDATPFFINRVGREKPEYKQNQFGGTFGGPIMLPGYNGRDRSFFFLNYEGFRMRQGQRILSTVPTPEQLRGDFSAFLGPQIGVDSLGRPILKGSIYDPLTTRPDGAGRLIRDPFPGNIIPANRINPASRVLADVFLSPPNLPGLVQNLINTKSIANNRDQFNIRVDHKVSEKTQIFGRFSFSNIIHLAPTALPKVDTGRKFNFRNQALGLTHVFSPTTTLDLRFGYNRTFAPSLAKWPSTRQQLFSQANIKLFQVEAPDDAPPIITIAGVSTLGIATISPTENTFQWIASLSKVKGRHILKMGTDILRFRFLYNPTTPINGNLTLDSTLTNNPQSPAQTGNSVATFLLGYPSFVRRAFGDTRTDARQTSLNLYLQDDIRLVPKLTLNLGLRYEYHSPPVDVTGRLGSLQREVIGGRVVGVLLWATTNPLTGEPANARKSIIDPDFNDFAPRFGLAYRLNDKTVVRGGYGIFYTSGVAFQQVQDLRKHWPFLSQQAFTPNRGIIPDLSLTDDIPFEINADISGWPQNKRNRTGYSQQWNLDLQQEILKDLLLDVGYLGSHNLKLIRYVPINDARPGPGPVGPRRLMPEFGPFEGGENDSWSKYHALQVKLEKRSERGLSFLGMYTFSKSIDNQSSLEGNHIQDMFNLRGERGLSNFDLRHNFVFSYIYELPFGEGKRLGANLTGIAKHLLSGWQITGITRFTSGAPIYVNLSTDHANVGSLSRTQRPDLVGDWKLPKSERTVDRWFNTAAFALPPPFTFGNAGRNIVIADGRNQWDLGVLKNIRIKEDRMIQFRAEFFNLFNHPDFGDPDGTFGSSAFGRVSSTVSPRDIQFGLKLIF